MVIVSRGIRTKYIPFLSSSEHVVRFLFLSTTHAIEQNEVISAAFRAVSKIMFGNVAAALECVVTSARLFQSSLVAQQPPEML